MAFEGYRRLSGRNADFVCGNGEKSLNFPVKVDVKSSNEEIAATIRKLLNINPTTQKGFRKPDKALAYCIAA